MFHAIKIGLSVAVVLISTSLSAISPAGAQADTCPNAPPASLIVGQSALVTPGVPNNLRASPSKTAKILAAIPGDTAITVLAAPKCADGLRWWNVTDGKLTGWMAEGNGANYSMIPIATDPATVFTFDGVTATSIAFRNIRLTYISGFGKTIQMEVNPVTTPNCICLAPLYYAAYTHFNFSDINPVSGPGPEIYVFASADVTSATGESGNPNSDIIQLQTLLKKRPTSFPLDPSLPLNWGGARTNFVTAARYLKFNSGRGTGLRYLAYISQGPAPILADSLLYSFQGLTDDGRYYVMAKFPILASVLPGKQEDASDFWTAIQNRDDTATAKWLVPYYTRVIAQLTAAPPSSFTPRLDQIDALMQSIIVHYINIRTDWF